MIRPPAAGASSWKTAVAEHQTPTVSGSTWQLANSVVPYLALSGLMLWSLDVSYALTLALAVPAAGFLVRIFIIFHDCGHGSFFRSRGANHFWGVVTGVLTYTPYQQWRHDHAIHHATSGAGKSTWWRWLDRFESYYNKKFEAKWKDKDEEFWRSFPYT